MKPARELLFPARLLAFSRDSEMSAPRLSIDSQEELTKIIFLCSISPFLMVMVSNFSRCLMHPQDLIGSRSREFARHLGQM
jgi:hypothetical protein